MSRQTWEEERDARRLEHIERLLEQVLARLPPPPRYLPTVGIVVVPTQAAAAPSVTVGNR